MRCPSSDKLCLSYLPLRRSKMQWLEAICSRLKCGWIDSGQRPVTSLRTFQFCRKATNKMENQDQSPAPQTATTSGSRAALVRQCFERLAGYTTAQREVLDAKLRTFLAPEASPEKRHGNPELTGAPRPVE